MRKEKTSSSTAEVRALRKELFSSIKELKSGKLDVLHAKEISKLAKEYTTSHKIYRGRYVSFSGNLKNSK